MKKPLEPTPIHLLKVGEVITPRFSLTKDTLRHFKFSSEFPDIPGSLVANVAQLKVMEVSPLKLNEWRWVRVAISGSSPPWILKLSAEEYMGKFWKVAPGNVFG